MATAELNKVIGHLRSVLCKQDAAGLSDGELLERYLQQRDEAAFETLVRRHGPMVLGVCRRILRNPHDADDAFQATFLVLLHKAFSLRSCGTVGNWLYGVSYRTAQEARRAILKRRTKEAKVVPKPGAPADALNHLREALDHELERLPEKYRTVIVLFDLEGATGKEVALRLGVPEGTVASRLARGRAMLAKRLIRHGLPVTAAALAGILSQQAASACVSPSLVASTMKAASLFAAGKAAAGAISAKVVALTQGVIKTMLLTKLKAVATVTFVVAVLGVGAGGLIHRTQAAEDGDAQTATENADQERSAIVGPAQKIQIRINGPAGMKVCLWPESGENHNVAPIEIPGRLNLAAGKRTRLKLYGIPNRPGVERFPAIEIPKPDAATEPYVTSSAIPVEFTDEDFAHVNSGRAITKVVYLTTGPNGQKRKAQPGGPMGSGMGAPRTGGAEPETKGQKTVGRPGGMGPVEGMPGPGSSGMMAGPRPMKAEVGQDQGQVHTIASYDYPQRDVIEVAKQRGTIVAVVRMGDIDLGAGQRGKYQGRVKLLEKAAVKPVEITLGDDGIQGRAIRPDNNAKAKDKDKRAEQLAKYLEIVERDLVRVQGWNNDLKKRLEDAEMWKRSLQTLLECKEQELKKAKAELKKAKAPGGKSQTDQPGGSAAALSAEIGSR